MTRALASCTAAILNLDADKMEIIDTKRANSPLIRVPTFTEVATFVAGTLYIPGFVIANVYYASYEIVRFEFFRGRYVAAALLFVVAAMFPGWMGWQTGAQFRGPYQSHAAKDARLLRFSWYLYLS